MIPLLVGFIAIVVGMAIVSMGPLAALGVAGLAAIPICVKYPRYPIYAFMLSSFFGGANVNTGVFVLGLDDLGILGLIAVWVIRRLSGYSSMRWPLGFGWITLYVALAYLSLINGVSPDGHYGVYVRFLSRVLALVAFIDLVREEGILIKCLYCLGVSALIHAIIAFSLNQSMSGRLGGLIDQPNLLGCTLALGLIPLVALLQTQRNVVAKALYFGAITIITVAIILAGSRGVYIALLPTLMWSVRRFPTRIIIIGALGTLSVLSAKEYSEKQVQSIERRLHFRDISVDKRTNVLETASRLTLKFPILGIGFGQISDAYKVINVEYDRGRTAHSFLVGIAASMGIPALIAMIMFLWSQVRGILKHRRWLARQTALDKQRYWLSEQAITIMLFEFISLLARSAQMFDWVIFALIGAMVCTMRDAETTNAQGDASTASESSGATGELDSGNSGVSSLT